MHRASWHMRVHVFSNARARQCSMAHRGGGGGGGATGGAGGSALPPPHTNPPREGGTLSQSAAYHPSLPSICAQLPVGGSTRVAAWLEPPPQAQHIRLAEKSSSSFAQFSPSVSLVPQEAAGRGSSVLPPGPYEKMLQPMFSESKAPLFVSMHGGSELGVVVVVVFSHAGNTFSKSAQLPSPHMPSLTSATQLLL